MDETSFGFNRSNISGMDYAPYSGVPCRGGLTATFARIFKGDMNDDKNVNLMDVILALKVIEG